MKYKWSWYTLFFIFVFQSTAVHALPLFMANPSMSYEEQQRLKKLDYYSTLAMIAWSTGEFDSYKKVPGAVADFAVTHLACKGLCKYTGVKDKHWAVPFLPFLALGGKQAVNYFVSACKSGYACKGDLKKRYGKVKWLPYFLMGVFVPYMMRKEITNKAFGVFNDKTGLTDVEYPDWVFKSTMLTFLVWQFHGAVVDWCGGLIQSAYDAFVPETKTEKYLRIKAALAKMAKAN